MLVGFVSCSKKKLAVRAAARDLYCSPLYRLSRTYVESRCERWAILSAKYGLVLPTQIIEPYDQALSLMSALERKLWAETVARQISREFSGADGFIVLAGRLYSTPFVGLPATFPLRSLSMGARD